MKEQVTKCYNITTDLLNKDDLDLEVKNKLNEVYELLTEMVLELENGN